MRGAFGINGHQIVRLNALFNQIMGQTIGSGIQLGVGYMLIFKSKGNPLREFFHLFFKNVVHAFFRREINAFGHPLFQKQSAFFFA